MPAAVFVGAAAIGARAQPATGAITIAQAVAEAIDHNLSLLAERYNVSFEDVRAVFPAAARHRVLLNFEAQAENLASDAVLAAVLAGVKERDEAAG